MNNVTSKRVRAHREKTLHKTVYVGCFSTSHPHKWVISDNNTGRYSGAYCQHCGEPRIMDNLPDSVTEMESIQGWV